MHCRNALAGSIPRSGGKSGRGGNGAELLRPFGASPNGADEHPAASGDTTDAKQTSNPVLRKPGGSYQLTSLRRPTMKPKKASRFVLVLLLSSNGLCHALEPPRPLGPGTTNAPGPPLNDSFATLSWEPVPGASQYDVAIRDLESGVLENYVVEAPSNAREVVLVPGHPYRWNLSAVAGSEESAVSETLYFRVAVVPVHPAITDVLPTPAPGLDGEQFFLVNGRNFHPGCSVVLRDKSTGERFPDRRILSRRNNQLVLSPNFNKADAPWTVEVLNPGQSSSGEFAFHVIIPERLVFWRWLQSRWPWVWFSLLAIVASGIWHWRAVANARTEGRRLGHERLSRDLHDSVNDLNRVNLVAGKLKVMVGAGGSAAEIQDTASKVSSAVVEAINGIEDMIWAGREENDKLANLVARLRQMVGEFRESNPNLQWELNFPLEAPERNISSEQSTHLLRIASEALRNIVKHANANRVRCQLVLEGALLRLTFVDNGQGFQVNNNPPTGHGLSNMQQRAKELRGKLTLKSTEGVGTELILEIPL